jgi:hypothetical protein
MSPCEGPESGAKWGITFKGDKVTGPAGTLSYAMAADAGSWILILGNCF